MSDFTGRAAQVDGLRALLTGVAAHGSSGTAVVDVAGMGGVGKTALA